MLNNITSFVTVKLSEKNRNVRSSVSNENYWRDHARPTEKAKIKQKKIRSNLERLNQNNVATSVTSQFVGQL